MIKTSMDTDKLAGKVVVITGATTGIGEASAVEFAKIGAKLVLCGRNLEGLTDTKQQCVKQGLVDTDVALVTGDIRDEDTLDLIVKTAVETFDRVDVLFLSAGKLHPKVGTVKVLETVESLDYYYEVFVKSPYRLTHKLSAELIKTKGTIIFNSSIAAYIPNPVLTTYNLIKAAVDHMTKLFALTFANNGVRVNAIRPGWVRTDILSEQEASSPLQPIETMSAGDLVTPLGSKLATPVEVARVVVFLASSHSACMTGVRVTCDRGMDMAHPAVDWTQF